MRFRRLVITFILATIPVIGSHAAITTGYGAAAEARSFPNCAVLCPGPAGTDETDVGGGEFFTSALANVNNATGVGFASVSFTGDAFAPLLRARGTSPVGGRTAADGKATAIQGYTYMGATPQMFSILAELNGTITEPDNDSDAEIEGRVAVYKWANATFGTTYSSFILETVDLSGDLLVTEQLFLTANLDLSSKTLDFTLQPGDEVYVFAQLFAKGERGGSAISTNSLGLSFTDGDTSELQAAIVPVPAAMWLFGSAIISMIGLQRIRRA